MLLRSLAACYGAGAIGIVLSGTIAAGIAGIRAITRSGGITMAQNGSSSLFSEIPIGAIDQGKAELVLSPTRIPEALLLLAEEWERMNTQLDSQAGIRTRQLVSLRAGGRKVLPVRTRHIRARVPAASAAAGPIAAEQPRVRNVLPPAPCRRQEEITAPGHAPPRDDRSRRHAWPHGRAQN